MAFNSRSREPLLDTATQAALERRSKELLGLALLALGSVLALALASYSHSDPSFLGGSQQAPENWLGVFGAYTAAPLYVILGLAAWMLPVLCIGWAARFVFHQGESRALSRMIAMPIAVAVASVCLATYPPHGGWAHSFGLGGLFGDTALGVLLGLLPMDPGLGLKIASAILGIAALAVGLHALGSTREELGQLRRFLWAGLLHGYAALFAKAGAAGQKLRDRAAERSAARSQDEDRPALEGEELDLFGEPVDEDPLVEPIFETAAGVQGPKRLFARGPAFEPEEAAEPSPAEPAPEPLLEEESPRAARITGAIRSKLLNDRARAARANRAKAEPVLVTPMAMARSTADAAIETAEMPMAESPEDLGYDLSREAMPEEYPLEPLDALEDEDMPEPLAAPRQELPRAPIARPKVEHPPKRTVALSRKAEAEAQPGLALSEEDEAAYIHPPLSLLTDPAGIEKTYLSDEALEENARMLENVLDDYGVKGDIVSVRPGPVVTMYELEPAPGLKASRVIGLSDDIARSMSALSARVSTVPGRSVIGIELPNEARERVVLREILSSRDFGDSKLRLPLALGKDIGGEPVVANLAKMPHLLIAGTTGSGKSVAINTMILSLLYKLSPEECRLIMIDPKMLELSVYDGIPHLLSPVVTDPKKAVVALKWVVGEMEDRYRKMSKMGVRNIEGYNGRVREALGKGEMFSRTVQTGFDDITGEPVFETEEFEPVALPYIVVIVDEMADLMMVAGKEIEACIQRLAQMARASGIHLIMATQRPSVDVITGTIKANFPTRISFQVTSKVDSRTILGEMGAEQLLGMGDMLYMAGGAKITRVHGPFASDEEVEEIVSYLKQYGPPDYVGGVVDGPEDDKAENIDAVLGLGGNTGGEDALYDQAVQIVINDRKCSTSYIQRKLAIGYNKAARLVEQMEDNGVVSSANHVGKREVLVPEPQ
ncbi:MAG: DNA translocase FtsK 4TM domain-containing protein [Mangrovicoccus sp.]|nr:DNA translocase FtsK 4TM domain-containing protein [Mangrovicoccus sp.]